MNKLYEIWDNHIRNLIIFGFIALTMTLLINHHQDELYYQEMRHRINIGDSAVIDIGFGNRLVITKTKHNEEDSINNVVLPVNMDN